MFCSFGRHISQFLVLWRVHSLTDTEAEFAVLVRFGLRLFSACGSVEKQKKTEMHEASLAGTETNDSIAQVLRRYTQYVNLAPSV